MGRQLEHEAGSQWARRATGRDQEERTVLLEQDDGTFAASTTGSVPGGPLDALAAVASVLSSRFGEASAQNLVGTVPEVRWRLPDGTRLSAAAGDEARGGTPVTLSREKLPSPEDVAAARAELAALLDAARPR